MNIIKFTVDSNLTGERLDVAAAQQCAELTRARVQKLID
jgi:hypothetical protein